MYHIHGDNDLVVPLESNSAAVAQRYKDLGGEMTLNIVPNGGHDYWVGFNVSRSWISSSTMPKKSPDK